MVALVTLVGVVSWTCMCCGAFGGLLLTRPDFNSVWFARNWSGPGQVDSPRSTTNTEDGGFPTFALGGKLLVFRGFGRDASWKLNVLEDGVVLGDGHVDLGITLLNRLGFAFGLFLSLLHPGPCCRHIMSIHAAFILRVGPGGCASTLGLGVDFVGESIRLGKRVTDLLFDSLLNRWSYNPEEQGPEQGEEQLVLGFLQPDVEILDGDINFLWLDKMLTVVRLCSRPNDSETEPFAAQVNVHKTRIRDVRETLLLSNIVTDI